jgi:hypothetical protein
MESTIFYPPRRPGVIFQSLAIVLSALAGTAALVLALTRATGSQFVLLIVLALLFYLPLPVLVYRLFSLLRASYTLERDGLRLHWGLRSQDIPLPQVEWVRPASDLGFHLPLPLLRWPGSVVGARPVPDLGPVEFLAATTQGMLLLATPERVYAISPEDPRAFVRLFQRMIEYGSLSPIQPYSSRPAAFAERIWNDRLARVPLIAAVLLTLLLFVFVALMIPASGPLAIGFDPSGAPYPPVPPERLMLLPVLAAFSLVIDVVFGLYLYRSEPNRPISYLLWLSAAVTPLLLLAAVFLLR